MTKKNAGAEAQGGSDELSPELYDAAVAIFDCTGGKKNEQIIIDICKAILRFL